ncbi:hypothetical protein BaRGS_00011476 [Batillaria attramentaria]|uniref:Uncharacterized protein n=1 Tax=Batillaria attramentaria TaxID=370345 RepID=A0ABD0LCZ9_9CAEN
MKYASGFGHRSVRPQRFPRLITHDTRLPARSVKHVLRGQAGTGVVQSVIQQPKDGQLLRYSHFNSVEVAETSLEIDVTQFKLVACFSQSCSVSSTDYNSLVSVVARRGRAGLKSNAFFSFGLSRPAGPRIIRPGF